MKTATEKIFKYFFIIIVIVALAVPQPVFAQEGDPTQAAAAEETDVPPVEETTEVATEEATEVVTTQPTEVATEAATEVVTEEVVEPTAVETQIPAVEEAEVVADVVEAAAEADVTLVGEDGEPVVMAETDTVELITDNPDPWIERGGITYRFLADCTPYPDTPTEICTEDPKPIQAAINFANAGETVFLSGTFTNETLTIDKAITLDGTDSTTITAPGDWGTKDLPTSGTSEPYYYGLIYIHDVDPTKTVTIQNMTLNTAAQVDLDENKDSYYAAVLINNANVLLKNLLISDFTAKDHTGDNDDGVGVLVYNNPNSRLVTLTNNTLRDNEYGLLTITNSGQSWVAGSGNNFIGNDVNAEFPYGNMPNNYWGVDPAAYFTNDNDTGWHFHYGGVAYYLLFAKCNGEGENMDPPCVFNGTTVTKEYGSYTSIYTEDNYMNFRNHAKITTLEPYEIWPWLAAMTCPPGYELNKAGDECVAKKIEICHSDDGYPNYTLNNVSVNSVLDMATCTLKTSAHGDDPFDIIPPFDCGAGGTFAGSGDQTILANKCVVLASINLFKSSTKTLYTTNGEDIQYDYMVTNTSTGTLFGQFIVEDDLISGDIDCGTPPTGLAPGASVTCHAHYFVADGDKAPDGSITNTATAFLVQKHKKILTSNESDWTINLLITKIEIKKDADLASFYRAGQTINYIYRLGNTGNVTLTQPFTITDNKLGTITCPATPTSLAPTEHIDCTATYVTTTADVLAGIAIVNSATGSGMYGTTTITTAIPATESVAFDPRPSMNLVKTVDKATFSVLGETLTYHYVITNNGNVALSGPFMLHDDKLDAPGDFYTCNPAVTLAMGASVDCYRTHNVTQTDLDGSGILNIAQAYAGYNSTKISSNTDDAMTTPLHNPLLGITKVANRDYYSASGLIIGYSYVITNAGNVTLSQPFTVVDNKVPVVCPLTPATLAPGDGITCTSTYETLGTDVFNRLDIDNTANGYGFFERVQYGTSLPASESVPFAGITLSKSALETDYDEVGDVIHYSYLVTNIGHVDFAAPIAVGDNSDAFNGSPTVVCPAGPLAAGASMTCTATTTVTQEDIDDGLINNDAQAFAIPVLGGSAIYSNLSSVTVDAVQDPGLSLVKTVTSTGPYVLGSTITYELLVTNTGNVTLDDVDVTDANAIMGTCLDDTDTPVVLPVDDFAPDATLTCTATHIVTAGDITAGLTYDNTGEASGRFRKTDYTGQGSVTATLDILGCTDPTALNYNPAATLPDGSCTYPAVGGPLLIPTTGAAAINVTGGLIPVTGGTIIVSGLGHSCMTADDGRVMCWGLNASGQLGNGATLNKSVPVFVNNLTGVMNLTAGSKHNCALTTDGKVWCWGENSSGQLGNGTTTNSSIPVLVSGLTDQVVSFSAGEEFTCAMLKNKEVWCWGKNDKGQLNDGTTTNSNKPVKSQLTDLSLISGGEQLLLTSDAAGVVKTYSSVEPSDVKEATNVLAISANRWGITGCAVTFDGTIRCWGKDLVSGVITTKLPALDVGAGLAHNCALNDDETVSCWGTNTKGELGNGTNTNSTDPTLVKNLSAVHAIAVGAHHTCVLTGINNQAMCWGENNYGQLGDNSTIDSNLPMLVYPPEQ